MLAEGDLHPVKDLDKNMMRRIRSTGQQILHEVNDFRDKKRSSDAGEQ